MSYFFTSSESETDETDEQRRYRRHYKEVDLIDAYNNLMWKRHARQEREREKRREREKMKRKKREESRADLIAKKGEFLIDWLTNKKDAKIKEQTWSSKNESEGQCPPAMTITTTITTG